MKKFTLFLLITAVVVLVLALIYLKNTPSASYTCEQELEDMGLAHFAKSTIDVNDYLVLEEFSVYPTQAITGKSAVKIQNTYVFKNSQGCKKTLRFITLGYEDFPLLKVGDTLSRWK